MSEGAFRRSVPYTRGMGLMKWIVAGIGLEIGREVAREGIDEARARAGLEKLTPEQRAARLREEARAKKSAEKEAIRAAKQAEKEARKAAKLRAKEAKRAEKALDDELAALKKRVEDER